MFPQNEIDDERNTFEQCFHMANQKIKMPTSAFKDFDVISVQEASPKNPYFVQAYKDKVHPRIFISINRKGKLSAPAEVGSAEIIGIVASFIEEIEKLEKSAPSKSQIILTGTGPAAGRLASKLAQNCGCDCFSFKKTNNSSHIIVRADHVNKTSTFDLVDFYAPYRTDSKMADIVARHESFSTNNPEHVTNHAVSRNAGDYFRITAKLSHAATASHKNNELVNENPALNEAPDSKINPAKTQRRFPTSSIGRSANSMFAQPRNNSARTQPALAKQTNTEEMEMESLATPTPFKIG